MSLEPEGWSVSASNGSHFGHGASQKPGHHVSGYRNGFYALQQSLIAKGVLFFGDAATFVA
jgi:hypothetical protein